MNVLYDNPTLVKILVILLTEKLGNSNFSWFLFYKKNFIPLTLDFFIKNSLQFLKK